MKGLLLLFVDPAAAFQRDTEAFYNPKITKVEVTIEGVPNELYAQDLRAYQQWDEARKFHASGSKRHPMVGVVAKDLAPSTSPASTPCGLTCGPVMTTSSTARGDESRTRRKV